MAVPIFEKFLYPFLYMMITSFIGAFKEYTSVVSMFNGPSTRGENSTTYNMLTMVYFVYKYLDTQTSFAAAAAVFCSLVRVCSVAPLTILLTSSVLGASTTTSEVAATPMVQG